MRLQGRHDKFAETLSSRPSSVAGWGRPQTSTGDYADQMTSSLTAQPLRAHRGARSQWWAPVGAAALAACGCATLWFADPTTPGGVLPVCPTKALFGIDCPGCGGMRMVYSLMHGNIGAAVHYNALSIVAVAMMVWAYGAWVLGLLQKRRVRSWQHISWLPKAALPVVLVWFVVRNLPWAPFQALHV